MFASFCRHLSRENGQESDFDGQRFLNIAIQMIAQFFEAADASQNFGCGETLGERAGFFSCV
jgi:hypothetical protein